MGYSGIREETIEIPTESGYPITGDLREPETERSCPVVIICHSFMAFKDWGFFPHLGRKIAEAGFVSFAFNFSWNGVVDSQNRITDFGRFERNTFTKELADARHVIDAFRSGLVGQGRFKERDIVLLGHSRGGGIAVITAARDKRVKALVTAAAVSSFERLTPHQKALWRETGFLPLSKGTSVSPLRFGPEMLEDIEQNREQISIITAARSVEVPWLILHGEMDVTVRLQEAEALYVAADKSKAELVTLPAVGHLFNAASPDEDGYKTLNHVIDIITSWLHKHF